MTDLTIDTARIFEPLLRPLALQVSPPGVTLAIGEATHASRPIRFWPHALQFTNLVAVGTVTGGVRRISPPTVVVRRMPTVVTDINCLNAGIGQTVQCEGGSLYVADTNS
jgi:hypothetical protein